MLETAAAGISSPFMDIGASKKKLTSNGHKREGLGRGFPSTAKEAEQVPDSRRRGARRKLPYLFVNREIRRRISVALCRDDFRSKLGMGRKDSVISD